jgi:ribosomal protein S18 acetylase RimI-like enzyme
MPIAVAPLSEAEIVAAGRTLAAAFQDDPLQTYVFPDAEERARLSPVQFSTFLRRSVLFDEAYATHDLTGVAAWMLPGQEPTFEQAKQSGFTQLPDLMGRDAFERFGRVLDYLSNGHRDGLPDNYWYLTIIGVLPAAQGRGHAHALLKPVMARADAAGLSIFLDTAQPKVKPFYEKIGFRPMTETTDPDSGLAFWTYRRDPA